MFTDEMMRHRMFVRYCETHVVTSVSCLSDSTSITLNSTLENPLIMKVTKFKSIEQFIIVAEQKGIMKIAIKITEPIKIKDKNRETHFLLETVDGQMEIIFRNS
ncbi:hypothetical protein [Planomicrobium okeanokoites]|uniref:hypothetical protein n=1 Tax=Planomicrobium okeanokoites TaxID=244 RepID=UPI002492A05F|nr:hypothetical protein [Planomicrobium okeanokoites]